jgi:hypothetical protein
MSTLTQFTGGGSEIGDFVSMPDVGALIQKPSGQNWLRTGSVATASSYPLATMDYLKCTGAASTQAANLGSIYTDIATNGAGTWVIAYGNNTNVLYSTDNGATWATVAHNAGGNVTSVCWNATNSLFVCAGNGATVFYTSTQTAASVGSAWTARTGSAITSGTSDTALVRASSTEVVMTCGGGTTGNASRSTNGISWTAANFTSAPYSVIANASLVSLGSGIWVAIGGGATANQRSTDGGATWSNVAAGTAAQSCAFGAGICVAFENTGLLYTSANGATGTWTNRGNQFAGFKAAFVMFDGTRFIAQLRSIFISASDMPVYAYSTDGLTWSVRNFLNKSWSNSVQTRVHSDGTNLVFAPIFGSVSGAVYGTFAANTYIGLSYPVGTSGTIMQGQLDYVRVK